MSGYKNAETATTRHDELLGSTNNISTTTIVMDSSARDTDNTANPLYLRRGLLVTKIAATGKYKEYDNTATDGSENEEDAVVLEHDILMNGNDDAVAAGYVQAVLRGDAIIYKNPASKAAFDWSACQKLVRL